MSNCGQCFTEINRGFIPVRLKVVCAIMHCFCREQNYHVPKVSSQPSLTDRHNLCKEEALPMDLIPDCFLHCLLSVVGVDTSLLVCHLNLSSAGITFMLAQCIIQLLPEAALLFAINYCKNMLLCLLILSFASILEAVVKMSPAISFAMLAIEVTFPLGKTMASLHLLYCKTEWIANAELASSCFRLHLLQLAPAW